VFIAADVITSIGGFNPEVRESVAEEDLIRSFGVEAFPGPIEF
jgi:hypothetical protein